jgi:hypothetical protein
VAVSTIPAVKAALLARLESRPGLTGVQICYGAPIPNPSREFVWLGNVSGDQEWAAIGQLSRSEEYDLEVIVMVRREGSDQQACTERCFEIAEELAAELRSDPTLAIGGRAFVASFGGAIELEESASDTARGSTLTVGVHCMARI